MNIGTCMKRKLRSASFSKNCITRGGFTRRSAICRPLNSKPISRPGETSLPLRGGFLYEVLRDPKIYPFDGNSGIVVDVPSHRLDEFPVTYFSARCRAPLLCSAS